jgi:nucleolar pre-ribosomal-associated protein 1
MKYAKVLKIFRVVENTLEGRDTEEGLWAKRRKEIEKEVRRRVPEFQVVLGLSQQKSPMQATSGQDVSSSMKVHNPVRDALLQESAQRLLLLYHKYLLEVVSEARFDVGKALINFNASTIDAKESEDGTPGTTKRLHLVQRLHVIRTLKESDRFVWTNKICTCFSFFWAQDNPPLVSFLSYLFLHHSQIIYLHLRSISQVHPSQSPYTLTLLHHPLRARSQ